ncbi:MAG: potassium/proton antiporter [Synechococcaceae cyanobacterium SM1_2_3]|nr:potassium/proton antiporter [Synechococcaceae cyanobacterium SM1_2_3]
MDFTHQLMLLTGTLFLMSVLASAITARLGVPLLLVFLALGMLAGEDGPGGIHFEDVETTYLIGTVALSVILFNGGLCTDIGSFRVGLWPALWLSTVGVVVTAAITGLAAAWFLQLHWLEGMLIGAIVGSTDAAAVFAILHSHGLQLKQRVDATLQIESGINDPMAIFLTLILVQLLAAGGDSLQWSVVTHFIQQMGIGGAAGLGGGWGLAWLINRIALTPGLYPLLAFSGALLIFGATAVAGGSGYLAVYLAGLMLGNRPLQSVNNIRRFHDGLAWLSQIGMFLILGLLVTPHRLPPLALSSLLIAAVLILAARPVAVALCLLPFRFAWREQLFVCWVGLRGAVPIILALFPWLAGLEHYRLYFDVAFFVVLLSLVIQGWTVAPMARLLKLEIPPTSVAQQRLRIDLPGQVDYQLLSYPIAADSRLLGRTLMDLSWPGETRPAAVIRAGHLHACECCGPLQAGDHIYLFAQDTDLSALDQMFMTEALPPHLEAGRFFGELALNADAQMAELAQLYGLKLDPSDAADALEHFLKRRFDCPVVGDRVRLGPVEFVVREMRGERIVKVGMKLIVAETTKSRRNS